MDQNQLVVKENDLMVYPHRPSDQGPGAILTVFPPRRTVPDLRLRTPADDVWLTRRRQYATTFTAIAGAPNAYPDPSATITAWSVPFGLTLAEARAEWSRQHAAGWLGWELDVVLTPGPLAIDRVAS